VVIDLVDRAAVEEFFEVVPFAQHVRKAEIDFAVADAIAAFERTVVTTDSPFDRFVHGDHSTLTALEEMDLDGIGLFKTSGCEQGNNTQTDREQATGNARYHGWLLWTWFVDHRDTRRGKNRDTGRAIEVRESALSARRKLLETLSQ